MNQHESPTRWHTRRTALASGLAVAVLAGAWFSWRALRAPEHPSASRINQPTARPASVEGSKIASVVRIPLNSKLGPPQLITVGAGAVWVVVGTSPIGSSGTNEVYRIDPRTNEVRELPETKGVQYVAAGSEGVWVVRCSVHRGCADPYPILQLDPATGEVLAQLDARRVGGFVWNLATGDGAVWVSSSFFSDGPDTLIKLDPATNRVIARFPARGWILGAARGSVWVLSGGGWTGVDPEFPNPILRLDAKTGRRTGSILMPKGLPCYEAFTDDSFLRVSQAHPRRGRDDCRPRVTREAQITRVDLARDQVLWTKPLPTGSAVGAAGRFLWVATADGDRGISLRPMDLNGNWAGPSMLFPYSERNHFTPLVAGETPPLALWAGEGAVWVLDFPDGEVIRAVLGR
jgi:DNA-binding beta-propeller fold protein YncE